MITMPDNAVFSFKKALTGNSFPTGLTHGEIALNTYDNKLYVGGQTAISTNCVDSVEFVATFPAPSRMTREHFDIIVPAFQAEGIRIAHNLTSINLAGMSLSTPSFNETTFRNYLDTFVGGTGTYAWKKMASESGYTDYIGLTPYLLMLDTEPYMVGFADCNIPDVNQTVINALEYINRAHRIMKESYPSSVITEYSFPNLPGYFLNIKTDSADWNRKPPSVSTQAYESEKIRLRRLFKSRLSSPIAPSGAYMDYVDWGNFSAYAYYYESMHTANPNLINWRKELSKYTAITSNEALGGKKPSSCIFSPLAYRDENTVFSGVTAGPTAMSSVPNTIWTDQTVSDLLLKPVVDNGTRKFIYWMDWVPYYTDVARKCTTSTIKEGNNYWLRTSPGAPSVGDNETFFCRKVLNELIADTGVGATADITDNAAWCGTAAAQQYGTNQTARDRQTLSIRAGVQKTIKMVQGTKALLAGQNTNAYCSPATNTKTINTAYTYETFPKGYTSQGDKWLTGGSEYTWVEGFNGGSWIELNTTQMTTTPITVNDNYLSVKDFGAIGDGKTDDTLSIQRALNTVASMTAFGSATADKFLFFPPGTYIIGPSGAISTGRPSTSQGSTVESCLVLGLTGSLKLVGQNATLSCVPSDPAIPHASHMMILIGNGYDMWVDGLNFEGNNKSVFGLKLVESANTPVYKPSAKITNCKFQNFWTPLPIGFSSAQAARDAGKPVGVNNHAESTGLTLYGSWNNIVVDNCIAKNISREKGAGIFGGAGSCGITIQAGYYVNPNIVDYSQLIPGGPPGSAGASGYMGCKSATISNCYIENITSNEPTIPGYVYNEGKIASARLTDNVDCDGLKFFGGYVTGPNYINCRASIYGNHFVNCRGRDIKIQADEVTIVNNTSSLSTIPIISGGVRINCQISSGIVSNNVFHFDPVSTTGGFKSPFIEDGGPIAGGSIVSFYDGNADQRNRSITISNNTVYNNVPTSIGVLQQFFDNTEGEFVDTMPPLYATIRGNKIVGRGGCQRFALITGRQISSSYNPIYPTYYTFSDNMISNITGGQGIGTDEGQNPAFLMGSSSFSRCYISMHGNVHAGGYSVPHFVSSTSTLPAYTQFTNINAYSNTGIGLTQTGQYVYENGTSRALIPRLDGMGDPQSQNGGVMTVQSYTLNPGDTYVFPKKGYYGYGKFCMLNAGSNFGKHTQALFVQGSAGLSGISVGRYVTFGSPTSQTNLGLTGYMNVWVDANNCINVQQKMLPNNGTPENVPASGGSNYSSTLKFDLFSFG